MLATQTAITTTSNTVTDTLSTSNECNTPTIQEQQQQQQQQKQQPLHLYRNKNGESSTTNGSTTNINNSTHIKLERRDSSTSESSLEHLDLGRTPKKFNKATTSTPFVPNDKSTTTTTKPTITNDLIQPLQTVHLQQRLQESDDGNDYDDEESSDEKHTRNVHTSSVITQNLQQSEPQRLTHYKRRYCGRNLLDKRTSIQLEYNPDNPNSLRKKFRFNRSSSENVTCSNESGFVEGSHSSLLINNSSITNSHTHSKSNTSSAASTPPYNQQNGGISSPESGVGEREDMKYVCPICEVVSPTPHEFTNHIRCHNYASGDTENFTCRICSKVLSSASSLDRHVLVHTGERPFNCKYCHLTFTTNGNMHRHMRTHKQHQHTHHRRNSNGTKIISNNNNNNNNNNKNGAAVVISAAASIIAATTQNNINASAAGTGAGILNNPSAIALPYATATSNGPLQEGVKSSTINNYNSGSIDAVDHYSSNALSTGANGNGQRLNGLTNLESYESDGGCSSDNSTANSQLSQSNNYNNDNNNNNNINNNDIKLNNNNFKRKLLDDRTNGLKRCLNSDIINVSVVMPQPSRSNDSCGLVCPACNDNDFSNMLDLDNHMDSKHPDIPAKCKYCEVIFRTHHQLNIHPCTDELTHRLAYVNKMNVTRSLSLGDHCSNDTVFTKDDHAAGDSQLMEENENQRKEFFRQFYMNKAITEVSTQYQRVHEQSSQPDTAEDDVKSEPSAHDSKDLADIQSILNMTSSSSTSNFLKNFEQNVNTPSSQCSYDKDEEEAQDAFTSEFRKMKLRGEFPCKLCIAVFPNLRALKGHNRVHLSEAGLSGPFRCNMCPYSNCDKAALVRHMRTHNGDRPYECAVCNYAFTTKANCERHLRNRHAKTTREEVKRAIIYHPSEDSSCDDPTKKLHMFSSPECDDDNELIMCHTVQPKDRSTPVSHLKEMLTAGESPSAKPVKIQVKSLEQLLDKSSAYQDSYEQEKNNNSSNNESNGPIDMSMDALDLSKKSSTNQQKKHADQGNQAAVNTFARAAQEPKLVYPENEPINLENPKYEVSALEKQQQQQQQLFLAQQQLLTNPTQYLQQLYRNLMLPQLSPFFLPNSFMPNSNLAELQKFAPFLSRMFGTPTAITAPSTTALNEDVEKASLANSSNAMNSLLPQISPLMCSEKCSPNSLNSLPSPKDMQTPATLNMPLQTLPLPLPPPPPPPPPHLTSTMLSNAPVKMVLKNGVFMPKQKQRRYRTERPFACEHCSARFTLRSNMERHVKQQHPQYYAQRQRTGHHVMRGRGASNAGNLNSITHLQAAFAHNGSPAGLSSSSPISDQVKYAILAQQLKARKDTDLLHQALSHGSSNVNNNHMFHINPSNGPNGLNFINSNTNNNPNGSMEDDEDKLIIDEDGEDIIDDVPDKNDETENRDENPSEDNITLEINEENYGKTKDSENHAENVTKSILEQAIKAGHGHGCVSKAELKSVPAPNTMNSMIAQAPAVGKFLKEVASSPFKDESQDLVSVSKLVDNATSNSVSFNNYFRPSDLTNQMEHSDEEGLVASGSASESNNSGAEDAAVVAVQPKKKSAYSLAPNRVSCPYCQRMFPWSSSLRRHILTHTGQKPFKCSHCPLLFTTKSNCDRHLLRKHGNIESATSVYVPTEDVTEPIPPPKSVEEIEKMQRQRDEEERKRKADKVREREERERLEKEQQREKQQTQEQEQQQHDFFKQLAAAQMQHYSHKSETSQVSSADLPFKCHLCESSFAERLQCLEHIKCMHAQDFALLLSKGAIESDAETSQLTSNEEEERNVRGHEDGLKLGKYPDYSNRKVICAFCMRRFWSTEDLRRHMRTHSGERPFQCEICLRKFTLKHSMLRHMKKHNGLNASDDCQAGGDFSTNANSGSDYSDDEQTPIIQPNTPTAANNSLMLTPSMNASFIGKKIQELLNKANEWRSSNLNGLGEHKRNITEESNNMQHTDLIGNLLGISDQNMLNKLMSSPDEAAKLLGVDK